MLIKSNDKFTKVSAFCNKPPSTATTRVTICAMVALCVAMSTVVLSTLKMRVSSLGWCCVDKNV